MGSKSIQADRITTGAGQGLFRIRLAHLPACDYFISGDVATKHPHWWPRCTCNLDGTIIDIEVAAVAHALVRMKKLGILADKVRQPKATARALLDLPPSKTPSRIPRAE